MRASSYFLKIGLISSLALHSITQANATPVISEHQITSVSQLSDIRIDSWEFKTFKSLINQYNCINNFTLNSNQTINRHQFATELNTCITQIKELIKNTNSNIINRETLTTLQRLQTEFSAELVTLEKRVDLLENKIATLQTQQFSPQVELEGEIIFAVSGFAGGKKANSSDKRINENLVFSDRVRLSLETSFTGKDEMKLRLQARNTPELADFTGTQMANLGFDGDDDNEVELDELEYKFPLSQQTRMTLYALGGGLGDFVPSVNPLFSGSGDGSISTFGRENPIRRQGGGAGIGISHNLSDTLNLSLGYVTSDAANPERGIFASPYGAIASLAAGIAQLTLEPTKNTAISFTYLHSYNNLNTGTGSELTGNPFNNQADAIAAHSFGAEAAWQLNPNFTLGGRVGFIHATAENLPANPNAVISTWAVLLALTDIGKEGNFVGFVVGQPPKVTYNSFGDTFEDEDTSLHLEVFYNFQLTDDLAITPGLFVITNPEHNNSNDKIYVGTVRTTFTF
ncbi:iron uptake porin [Anabaena sp. CCY 0017]|uniref:iron uptake porin n=1 Tax=Anabaena sp. CCY 0017 TaxID=3103866 RepID=UPI0039C6EDCF